MGVNELYSKLHDDSFQELYNPNFYTLLQNLRGIKIGVKFLTNIKSSVCIAHQLIASFLYPHACTIFTIETLI